MQRFCNTILLHQDTLLSYFCIGTQNHITMKKVSVLLFLAVASIVTSSAYDIPRKGEIIYGTITDNKGPVAGIVVTERDSHDRILAQAVTDINGNYSFRLANPGNTLVIADPTYKTVREPICRQINNIEMICRKGLMDSVYNEILERINRDNAYESERMPEIPLTIIPEQFICGVIDISYNHMTHKHDNIPYGYFLLKDDESHLLVHNYFDARVKDNPVFKSDTIRIDHNDADHYMKCLHKAIDEPYNIVRTDNTPLKGSILYILTPYELEVRSELEAPYETRYELRDIENKFDKDIKEIIEAISGRIYFEPKPITDLYIPFRDFIHYNSVEDLFNNMVLYF